MPTLAMTTAVYAPLTADERRDLGRVLAAYPPGPLSDAARHLAGRIGINHQTLRHAIGGRRLMDRTAERIRRALPPLLGEYRDAIEAPARLEKAFDELTPRQKMLRLVAGMDAESAERLVAIAEQVFPTRFEEARR